jgi:hypothetical protein
METLLDALCGSSSSSSSSSSDSPRAGETAASGGGAPAAGGNPAVVQLSALLYGTFLKQAVLATGRSHRAASGGSYFGIASNAKQQRCHLAMTALAS